jgi:hypothetical protein
MAEPISPAARRPSAALTVLGVLVVTSAVVRSVFAWRHSVPRLFPDEYIYAALGQSIAHGHLEIRGQVVHFPGVVEPILAAPIWRLFPITTAYHLVQVENAVAASLAAIPIYLIARRIRLPSGYGVAISMYAVLIPELVIVSYTSADAVAYPIAVSAIAVAVASIDEPTTRKQIAFVTLAFLATLARVEYFALAPAYLLAAIVVDRRMAWHRHKIAVAALAPVGGLAALFLFGYYLTGPQRTLHTHYASWFFVQLFLLSIELGVVIVPGAVAALLKPTTRSELAFAVFFGSLALLIVAEATKPAAEKLEFKERYLFILMALTPIAFGLYIRNARPLRAVAVGIAAAIAVAAARLPLTEYTAATFKSDSQFLVAINESQNWFGAANSSLVIALLATAAAACAVVLALRSHLAVPIVVAAAVALAASVVATHADLRTTRATRARLPPDLNWVDHSSDGSVTAIETPLAQKADLLEALYWNTSVKREVLLGTAVATDAFSAPRLRVDHNGRLENVRGDILFHDFGATGWLANASRVTEAGHFTLWRPRGQAGLRLVVEGRFWDGWLNTQGRLRAWPRRTDAGVRVRFRLSLPRHWPKGTTVRLGKTSVAIRAGGSVDVACSTGPGPLDLSIRAPVTVITRDFRHLTARLDRLVITDHRPTAAPTRTCSIARSARRE